MPQRLLRFPARLITATCLLVTVWPVSASELLQAAKANDRAQVMQLLRSGAVVGEAGPQGDTVLHWMAFHGAMEAVQRLLDAGAPIDARVANGNTPLHLAAYNGHARVAGLLIDRGADPDARNVEGVTPLDWALRNGHQEVAQLLTARGAERGHPRAPAAADTTPAAGPQGRRPAPGPRPGGFRIQLYALGSEQRAVQVRQQLQREYADVLGDNELVVDPTQNDGRTLYRIRSGPFTGEAAREACARLKERRQACMVLRAP